MKEKFVSNLFEIAKLFIYRNNEPWVFSVNVTSLSVDKDDNVAVWHKSMLVERFDKGEFDANFTAAAGLLWDLMNPVEF